MKRFGMKRRWGWTFRTSAPVAMVVVTSSLGPRAFAEPPARVALTGGHIIPVVGEEIEAGTLLMEHGRITAIGKDVEIPYDAMVVDVAGKYLLPGLIDADSSQGLDVPNENLDVAAFLDVYDAVDPAKQYFENALREGITTVHVIQAENCVIGGLSRVVRPIGLSVGEMTVQPDVALRIATTPKRGYNRMTQMAVLREAFLDLKDYLERLAEKRYEQELKDKGKEIDVGPAEARKRGAALIRDEDYDDAHANLVRLTEGKLAAWIYCGAATDVGPALKVAKENGFFQKTVLVLGSECFKAVDEIKASGRPVILSSTLVHRERDPMTGELRETFVPKIFADKNVLFALKPVPFSSLGERYLNYQAARCVREGIPEEAALKAITLNPARMLGLDKDLGSLEIGKSGNVVVYSDRPLNFSAWVDKVYIDGQIAYDRELDIRLKRLFQGMKPDVAQAPKAEEAQKTAEENAAAAEGEAKPGNEAKPAGETKPADGTPMPDDKKDPSEKPKSSGGENRGGSA